MAVWHGGFSAPCHLDEEEMVAVIEKHFADCRRFYTGGSGDGHFHMVESAIRLAMEATRPSRDRAVDEPARPRRRSGGARKVHNASGIPDLIIEGRAACLLRDPVSNVERPSGLVGYEKTDEPIGEDEDADL